MTASTEKQCKCRLCGDYFSDSEMSEEHYPARNTGNEDIVAVDLGKMFDTFISENVHAEIRQKLDNGQTLESIAGDIFDSQLATSLFPKGRTARTLCRKCNTFLGKYDEAYKLIEGVGENGGYHAQVFMSSLFSQMDFS